MQWLKTLKDSSECRHFEFFRDLRGLGMNSRNWLVGVGTGLESNTVSLRLFYSNICYFWHSYKPHMGNYMFSKPTCRPLSDTPWHSLIPLWEKRSKLSAPTDYKVTWVERDGRLQATIFTSAVTSEDRFTTNNIIHQLFFSRAIGLSASRDQINHQKKESSRPST